MVSNSNGRVVDGATTLSATSRKDSNGDEASAEENVKEKAEESEEGDAAKKARKDDGETGVDDSYSRHPLDRLLPFWDVGVMVC